MSRRAAIVGVGAGVVVLLIWFVAFWGPQGGRLSDAEDREQQAEEENARLELQLSRLQDAQDRAPALAADLEELRRAVPDDPALAQFILDANDAAAQSGVEFLSISPTPPAAGDTGVSEVRLSISVDGGYFQVLDYLNRLYDLPRIVVIDTLALTGGADDAGTPRLSVSVTARMFTTGSPDIAVPEEPTTTTTTAPAGETTTTTATGETTTTVAGGEGEQP